MARKATDLLDVFRFSGEGEQDDAKPSRQRRARKRANRGAGKGAGRTRFEGIQLNPRQLLLASSALLLLLVLSFTLGLATGRPDAGSEASAALTRRSSQVAIRARLPMVDPATSKPATGEQVLAELARDFRIQRRNLRIRRDGQDWIVDVGPFSDEAEAQRYLRRSGLELAHIHMEDPFRYAEIVPVRWR
jgi:hypothetical protein